MLELVDVKEEDDGKDEAPVEEFVKDEDDVSDGPLFVRPELLALGGFTAVWYHVVPPAFPGFGVVIVVLIVQTILHFPKLFGGIIS